MKIYFDATPSKIEIYKPRYEKIASIITGLGHQLTSQWILEFDKSFFDLAKDKWAAHYKEIIHDLDRSDLLIAEISVSSTTLGQLIQRSLQAGKPVIGLKDHSVKQNIFLAGAGEVESKVLLVEYNEDNLEASIEDAINYVQGWLESRFTLILDGKTRRILDEVSKNGTSRSEYIRDLINKDFEKKE
jgi:hypothetical protein